MKTLAKLLFIILSFLIVSNVFASEISSDNGKFIIDGNIYFKDYMKHDISLAYNVGGYNNTSVFGEVLSVNNDGDVLFFEYLDSTKKTWDQSDYFIKLKKEFKFVGGVNYTNFVLNANFIKVKKYSHHTTCYNPHDCRQDGTVKTLFTLPYKSGMISVTSGKIDNNRNDTTINFVINSKNRDGNIVNKYVEIDNKKVKLIKVETIKVEKEINGVLPF